MWSLPVSDVVRQLQRDLTGLGFPCGAIDGENGPATRTAVARFQLAYGWSRLTVDGQYGPQTLGAMSHARSTGRLSPNFGVNECRSKGDGTAWVHRDLLAGLERLRTQVGRPLALVSAWRDPAHNRRVGGARTSQHTFGAAPELHAIQSRLTRGAHLHAGRAADFNRGYIRLQDCVNLRLFSGIGHRDGWVTHVDVRSNANVQSPTVWVYG
jgi:peptidoglycan hydrolase-like protein with peptidoglycan-binding domain